MQVLCFLSKWSSSWFLSMKLFNAATFPSLLYIDLSSEMDFYFRWVQTECRRLGDIDNPEVAELLRTAVRCLKERPVLLKYCAEEVVCL